MMAYLSKIQEGSSQFEAAIKSIEKELDNYQETELVVIGFLDLGVAAVASRKDWIRTSEIIWNYADLPWGGVKRMQH